MTDRRGARIVRAEVCEAPVDVAELAAAVEDRAAGAVVTFDGRVRDHDAGRGVKGIAYSAHPSAGEVVARIAAEAAARPGLRALAVEAAARPGLRALAVVHRYGELGVGQTALAVAVSADHRGPAFEAVRDIVEEIKRRLPVWKRQFFDDGSAEWSNIA